jgi:hypothetical protein
MNRNYSRLAAPQHQPPGVTPGVGKPTNKSAAGQPALARGSDTGKPGNQNRTLARRG